MASQSPRNDSSNTNTFYTAESPRSDLNDLENMSTPRKGDNLVPTKLNFGEEAITPRANSPVPKETSKNNALPPMAVNTSANSYTTLPMKLVSNPTFISMIYTYVVRTAKHVTQFYINYPQHLPTDVTPPIAFFAENITIIGGAVITLFDFMMKGYKERHQLQPLSSIFEKGTSDIDMTWNMAYPPNVIRSEPQQLILIGSRVADFLQRVFDQPDTIKKLHHFIEPLMPEGHYDIRTSITSKDVAHKYGSFSIAITIFVNNHPIKIGDLTLHDGYNSQQFDDNHKRITAKQAIMYDPTYCISSMATNSYGLEGNTISLQPIISGSEPIRIPTISRFVYQQLFAAGNMLLNDTYSNAIKTKGYTNIRRVVYILYLLHAYQSSPENARNISYVGITHPYHYKLNIFSMVLRKYIMIQENQRTNTNKESIRKGLMEIFSITPQFYQILTQQMQEMLHREQISREADQLQHQIMAYQRSMVPQQYIAYGSIPGKIGKHKKLPTTKKGGRRTQRKIRRTYTRKN